MDGPEYLNNGVPGNLTENKRLWKMPLKLLISSAVFGILFSLLFCRQEIGLNVSLLVLLIYSFAAYNKKVLLKQSFKQQSLVYLATVPVLCIGTLFFVSDTGIRFLGLPVMLFIIFIQYIVLSDNAVHSFDEGGFVIDIIYGAINRVLFSIHSFVAGALEFIFKGRKKSGVFIGILIGAVLILISLPVLSYADENMANIFNDFLQRFSLEDVFLYLFLFILGASAIAAPASMAESKEYTGNRGAVRITKRPVMNVTTGVALTMLLTLYLLFAIIQFRYFFIPKETLVSVLGLTSSAYAVKGFGELIFITCLNFIIISLALKFTKQKNERHYKYNKILYLLLVLFNFIIMASSHLRMQIYVDSFGHSILRFLSHSFMLLLLVLNIIMLARILSDKVKAVRLFAAAAVVYFVSVAYINPERFVARANIDRYEQTGDIDAKYLLSLSADSVIVVCDFLEKHNDIFDESMRDIASQRLDLLKRRNTGWQSLNLSVVNAKQKLEHLLKVN